jgi:hypothetical protein
MDQCPNCGLKISDRAFMDTAGAHCPNCGTSLKTPPSGERGPIAGYFADLRGLAFAPSQFFRRIPVSGGLTGPLVFALVSHWIGAAVSYLWNLNWKAHDTAWLDQIAIFLGKGQEIESLGHNARWVAARERVNDWLTGVGSIVLDPFTTLLWIFVGAVLLFISARLFVGAVKSSKDRPARLSDVTFESVTRIVAYSQAASLLSIIPFAGKGLSVLAAIALSVIGAREFYNIGTGRALLIVLFPRLLTFFLIFGAIVALVIGVLSFVFTQM